jgi:phosphatidate cytidylyltransferase
LTGFPSLWRRLGAAAAGLAVLAATLLPDIPVLNAGILAVVALLAGMEASRLYGGSRAEGVSNGLAAAGSCFLIAFRPDLAFALALLPLWLRAAVILPRRGAEDAARTVMAAGGLASAYSLGLGLLAVHRIRGSVWMMMVPLLVCWVGDSAAYFVGCWKGTHRLSPRVSPNKSWEGFGAGLAGAALGAWLAGTLGAGLPATQTLPVGLGAGLLAVLGDLAESAAKRDAGVKDSGALLPGHGGVLERFDSLTAVAPATLAWLLVGGWLG